MDTLGTAVEYAVLSCRIPGQEFLDLFQISGAAERFGRGDVALLSGMSGIELANHILARCGKKFLLHRMNFPRDILRNTGSVGSWHTISGTAEDPSQVSCRSCPTSPCEISMASYTRQTQARLSWPLMSSLPSHPRQISPGYERPADYLSPSLLLKQISLCDPFNYMSREKMRSTTPSITAYRILPRHWAVQ